MTEIIKPLYDLVLLQRPKAEKIGSILVPKDVQKRHATLRCRVIDKGPTASDEIAIGDNVLIAVHTGTWINSDGKPVADENSVELFICKDTDILAVIMEKTEDVGRSDSEHRTSIRALLDEAGGIPIL